MLLTGFCFILGFLRDALHWLPLQVFGRLSYCAYLIHVAFIRVRGGLLRTPLYVNSYVLVSMFVCKQISNFFRS